MSNKITLYRIKPLKWKREDSLSKVPWARLVAETLIGIFEIVRIGKGHYGWYLTPVDHNQSNAYKEHISVSKCKEAAEKHYKEIITKALILKRF